MGRHGAVLKLNIHSSGDAGSIPRPGEATGCYVLVHEIGFSKSKTLDQPNSGR